MTESAHKLVLTGIQKVLKSLYSVDPDYEEGAQFYSEFAQKYADQTLKTDHEKQLVAEASLSV